MGHLLVMQCVRSLINRRDIYYYSMYFGFLKKQEFQYNLTFPITFFYKEISGCLSSPVGIARNMLLLGLEVQ